MYRFLKILKVNSVIALMFLSCQSFAQRVDDPYTPDARLYECMSRDYLQQLSAQKSELILYYNYYLEHSFYVVSLKSEKPVTGTDIHTIKYSKDAGKTGLFDEKSFDLKTFNVMKYDFPRQLDGFNTYVWDEAGVALVFYPVRHFQSQFKYYQKNTLKINPEN